MNAPNTQASDWADTVADAYAAEAKPPLTDELASRIRGTLAGLALVGSPLSAEAVAQVNAALDAFEVALEAVAGPRLVEAADGVARMAHRSEAGRPLRSFGGQ